MKDDCLRKVARTVFVSLCCLSCATLFFLVFPFSKLLSPSMHSDIISQLDDYVIESLINWVNNKEKRKGKEINRRIILYFLYNNPRFFLFKNSSFVQRIPPTGKLNSLPTPLPHRSLVAQNRLPKIDHLSIIYASTRSIVITVMPFFYRTDREGALIEKGNAIVGWPTLVESIPGPFRARR